MSNKKGGGEGGGEGGGDKGPSWEIGDYIGHYHNRRIAKDYPIPGSQLVRETRREHEAKERWRRPERLVEAQIARSKHTLKQAETIRSNLAAIKSTYGWQANIAISENLVEQIDDANKSFAERREPSVETANARKYSKRQKRLLSAIKTKDYRDLHAMFLDTGDGTLPPDCNFSVGPQSTPLQIAVRKGDIEMTKILIKQGRADVNYPNSMGLPALFYVFEEWREQVLYKVPGKDSLIKMLDRSIELILLLCNNGANVNAIGLGGETPVHVASGLGHARHLYLLCKFGFDPKLKNNVGQLAVDVARKQNKSECVIILSEFSKIKREVELEIFCDAWKPFLKSNLDDEPRSMHNGRTAEDILHELTLKDRVRQNDIIERTMQFGTSVKFVRDNDDVLARDGWDEDESVLQTEVVLQAMRNALNTRGLDTRALTAKEVEDEKQRIAKDQALKFRKGGLPKKQRHQMKKEKALQSSEERKFLNPLKRRRLQLTKTLLDGYKTPSLTKNLGNNTSNFERLLNKTSGNTEEHEDDEEDKDSDNHWGNNNKDSNVEPLRPAMVSALFRPKRISPSKMTRGSRASLLPLGLTRLKSRAYLQENTILLPCEKLALEESKTKEQIIEEQLEALLKGDGDENDNNDNAVATAVIPANLLPPPAAKKITVKKEFDDGEDEGKKMTGKKNDKQSKRVMRSLYHGFAPGFKPVTQPWKQTVFSMQLPRVQRIRGNGTHQF
jgi:hypothetical protein